MAVSPFARAFQRQPHDLRPLRVTYDIYPYAAGSTLFEMGDTKILCSVMIQAGVPSFMRGKGNGWLTAEYSMLPGSTPIRTMRETSAQKRSGRTIEISRLIGRALRSVTQLAGFGEHTIFIDCDVLQADGSTRTASVTAAYLALRAAEMRWLDSGFIRRPLLTEEVAAVSVGVTPESRVLLDIDYSEDSTIGADFNFVMTRSQKIIEMQGTAESLPLSLALHDELRAMALVGLDQLFKFYDERRYVLGGQASPIIRPPSNLHEE